MSEVTAWHDANVDVATFFLLLAFLFFVFFLFLFVQPRQQSVLSSLWSGKSAFGARLCFSPFWVHSRFPSFRFFFRLQLVMHAARVDRST